MNFDKFSNDYAQIYAETIKISGESSDYFYKYKINILNSFYSRHKIDNHIKLLDLGCGIGQMEDYICSVCPGIEIYGIDTSEKSINVAREKNKEISFFVYDGKKIPFEDNFFDAVLLSNVLHHILPDDRKNILDEIHRALKVNGYLFIFEHNPLNLLTRYVVKTCVFDKDAHLLTNWNCSNIIKKSGFFSKEAKYIVFFPKFLKFLRKFEEKLGACPLGAQYFIAAYKK